MSELDDLAQASADVATRPSGPRTPVSPGRSGRPLMLFAIAAVVIGLGFAGWLALNLQAPQLEGPPDVVGPPPVGAGRRLASKSDAWVAAKYFVKTKLPDRATADFGPDAGSGSQNPDERVLYVGGNNYRVTGWVESRDPSGSTVRHSFDCNLRYSTAEQWQLDHVKLLPAR